MAKVAVLGYGVVGSGTVEVLMSNASLISSRIGEDIEVKYILNLITPEDSKFKEKFTTNINDIISDPEITVVAEAIGGVNPVFDFVMGCLKAGKHVITANKQLVAEKGDLLLATAKENNVKFLFEASVGGGIPIIRPLHQCLVANNILSIKGILNGTSNYILTKMQAENLSFNTALKQAQDLGYAEADPSADVDGMDTCRKISILSSIVTGQHIHPDSVHLEGIRNIKSEDLQLLNKLDMSIKLVGSAVVDGHSLEVMVVPRVTRSGEMLHHVNDAFNAVQFVGDHVGPVFLSGYGAGKNPTASAMVSDIVECVQRPYASSSLDWMPGGNVEIRDYKQALVQMLIRYKGEQDALNDLIPDRQDLDNSSGILTFITPVQTENEIDLLISALGSGVIFHYRMADIEV